MYVIYIYTPKKEPEPDGTVRFIRGVHSRHKTNELARDQLSKLRLLKGQLVEIIGQDY